MMAITQPVNQTQPAMNAKPMQTQMMQQSVMQNNAMPVEEKSRKWLWIIIAVVVVLAGVGSYFLFF